MTFKPQNTIIGLVILITTITIWYLFRFVDLIPHVDYDVFFASDDPSYKADIEITKSFQRNDSLILLSFSGDMNQPAYQNKVKQMGDFLSHFKEVKDIKSIMRGPRNVPYALKSPLWSKLLISSGGLSTNMLVVLKREVALDNLPELIPKVENLKAVFESPDFTIKISGFPYITELIRRHLSQDLRAFTLLAFCIFGLVVILIFHSGKIFLGMVLSCFNAAALTLICSHFLDIKIGILTANLTTIIFVMTISHIVFLTFNWKNLPPMENSHKAAWEAMKITFPASFWSMATTLLGFLSLLYVQAKPIRELGASGSIGTLIAFLTAYGIYPFFLRLQNPHEGKTDVAIKHFYSTLFRFFNPQKRIIVICILGFIFLTFPYLKSLNLDPSLLSFFSEKSEITKGLKYIDKNGGSNPLIVVVKSETGEVLDTKTNVKKLMRIQRELEGYPDVGTLMSMPLLVEEARRSTFLSFFLSNKRLLNWMALPKYGEIAKGFINEDHKETLFLFRMKEEGRQKHRLEVIKEIHQTIQKDGFVPTLTGGVYALQGQLSQHVAKSMVYGLGQLLMVFVIIALIAAKSLRTGFAMSFSIGIIPLCIFGAIGMLKMPLDIIAAPAANIAVGMGIDAMLHMVNIYHRIRKPGEDDRVLWERLRERMWEPILTSMFIVGGGFAIFFFSSFPPTQRFGGSIVFGTVVAAFSAQFIFPLLACRRRRKKPHNLATQPLHRVHTFKDIDLN